MYTVQSTERTRKSGADAETKALLYLMNFQEDSNDIFYFIVDFFNDLTGMDNSSSVMWDLQSKADKNNPPGKIGRELVTLFKNYLSDLKFKRYILFIGGVNNNFRIDNSKNVFTIENIEAKILKKIQEGLRKEATDKEYINNIDITDENIVSFLNNVVFVIDDKKPSEYVKAIIKNHPNIITEEKILDAIFNEIRDKQSSKKNVSKVEGIVIQTMDEALNYYRHLTANEIKLLTLQRIINRNPVSAGVPQSFIPIFNACPPEEQNILLDNCKASLCRALFNKNASDIFWKLFQDIYKLIISYPNDDITKIYNNIDSDLRKKSIDFDTFSMKYFIAIIKEGIQK